MLQGDWSGAALVNQEPARLQDKQGKTQQALAKAEGHHNKNFFFLLLCQYTLSVTSQPEFYFQEQS